MIQTDSHRKDAKYAKVLKGKKELLFFSFRWVMHWGFKRFFYLMNYI